MEIRENTETAAVVILKTVLYLGAALLYLRTLATTHAIVATCVLIVLAVLASTWARAKRLRFLPAAAIAVVIGALAFPLSRWMVNADLAALDARTTLLLADATAFGLLAFGLVFGLRTLAARSRVFDVVEAAVVVGAVAHTFANHRNQSINRPRFLSDWAWSQGIDPQIFLHGLGVAVAVLAGLMLLRRQRVLKLLTTLVLLLAVAGGIYWYAKDLHIEPEIDTNGLGLTTGEQGKGDDEKGGGSSSGDKESKGDKGGKSGGGSGDGKGDGKGGGKGGGGKGDGGGAGGRPPPPSPVAVAVFHKDFEPENGILYFRQQVLSRYDGHRLVSDPSGIDVDVITKYPHDGPIKAEDPPEEAFHVRVPTSMFLLAEHPQPVSLSGAVEILPKENPSPRRFVAAYEVVTRALSQTTDRLLGRRSIPQTWTPERRAHYLQTPDDPRYGALAQEILRDLDPRFVNDDLMKALAIKRYLEQNGFYTRKERHVDEDDPAASFLFGSLRGYCVHFAHSAAHLFRSQGIASRVALGYAVSLRHRGEGSSVLIMGDRAHAWPEIHIDGVGWITFDIYPEQSDEPAQQVIDQGLESLLGELARKDKSAGMAENPLADAFEIPWAAMGLWAALILGVLLLLAYAVKVSRRLGYGSERLVFAGTVDRFSDIGEARQRSETWERYAHRVADLAPSMRSLVDAHLRATLGGRPDPDQLRDLSKQVASEYAQNVKWWKKALGWINPVGWWFTR